MKLAMKYRQLAGQTPPGPPEPPTRHLWGVGGTGPGARPAESESLEIGITDEDTRGPGIDSQRRAPRRAPLDTPTADLVRRLQAAWDRSLAEPADPQLSLLGGEQ